MSVSSLPAIAKENVAPPSSRGLPKVGNASPIAARDTTPKPTSVPTSQPVRYATSQTLSPIHTEKARVARTTPRFPKRDNSNGPVDMPMSLSNAVFELGVDTSLLRDEVVDPEVQKVQDKLQTQLKGKQKFQMLEDQVLDRTAFSRTLKRHGLDLDDHEQDILFRYYDRDGGGTLDYSEFFKGLRGSEYVQTARSYGFETPDPHYHDELIGGGFGHYFPITTSLPPKTPRAFKAWLQQYASETCPFGTDRKIFGGKWQYRTSFLMQAHPIVSPRYGKTGFPARKTLTDILHVMSDKMDERSTSKFAFYGTFRQFDRNGDGVIDRQEFEKVLDKYNINLKALETEQLFQFFCSQDGGIRYGDLVKSIEDYRRKHPLGGIAGTAFGIQA